MCLPIHTSWRLYYPSGRGALAFLTVVLNEQHQATIRILTSKLGIIEFLMGARQRDAEILPPPACGWRTRETIAEQLFLEEPTVTKYVHLLEKEFAAALEALAAESKGIRIFETQRGSGMIRLAAETIEIIDACKGP